MLRFLLHLTLLSCLCCQANTVISYSVLEDNDDKRLEYILAVLDLTLFKTKDTDGDYQIVHIPHFMNLTRSLYELNNNTYPNYFLPGGVNIQNLGAQNLITADYPADQGLLSYRICFVNSAQHDKVAASQSLDQLKQFKIAQGTNWPDVTPLEANGFTVVANESYTGLFKMVLSGRADLFCRGVAELRKELDSYKKLGELDYDKSFALHYPMPYKLYFNKASKAVVERIERGLLIAKNDGSLNKLFWMYHHQDLDFAQLHKRKIYYLHSPYETPLSSRYKSYLIDPLNLSSQE